MRLSERAGNMTKTAQLGDRVRVKFSQRTQGSAASQGPRKAKTVEFTVGSREVLPGLSLGVEHMVAGDRKQLVLEPHDAYGPAQPLLVREIPRRRLSKQRALAIGQWLTHVEPISGHRERVRIIEIRPMSLVVDGNHPLAGMIIQLDVMLVTIDSSSYANPEKQQFELGGEG
jgi:FKBP-type peptidyl-prolyl cis-trans isomerase 2